MSLVVIVVLTIIACTRIGIGRIDGWMNQHGADLDADCAMMSRTQQCGTWAYEKRW